MSVELALLTRDAARALTEEVKADAAALWSKLLQLYEGGAHTALGYPSWGDYYAAEFGQTGTRGYQLLEAARVVSIQPGLNERQARELTPVLRDDPEQVPVVWNDVVQQHGSEPTAAQVRETVEHHNGMAVHYSSATDEWATPQALFDALAGEFAFDLDVCALDSSAKCSAYYTPAEDGLSQPWTGICWMNPPYGDAIVAWVRKAWQEAQAGATVVCLVPARVDTAWWWDYCRPAAVRFLPGRLKFGGASTGAPFPSAVVVMEHGRPANTVYWDWKR